ncbi:MAG: hypothetical protein IT383_27220 [Deltaproteobacteria bacterium]|nr:hypothetical protein [Deltaproteobacteria bacterium]
MLSSSRSLAPLFLVVITAAALACSPSPSRDDEREERWGDHRRPSDHTGDAAETPPPPADAEAPPTGSEVPGGAPDDVSPGTDGSSGAPPSSSDPTGDDAVPVDPCAGETLYGRCDGNTLVYCAGAVVERRACGDDACSLVNDEIGYFCLDPAFSRVLEVESPSFLCETPAGVELTLTLHAGSAVATRSTGSPSTGSYGLQSDGTISLTIDGVLDVSLDTFETAAGMLLQMSGPELACAVLVYEHDDAVEASAGCSGSFIEPGLVATDTSFELHRDGTVTVYEEMYLVVAGDVLYSTYHGIYRVTGAEIGIAWLDGDEVRGALGYVDDDGFLVVPDFSDPVCDD